MTSNNPNKQACEKLRGIKHKFDLNKVVLADLKPRKTDIAGKKPIPLIEELETRLSDWEKAIQDENSP